MARAERALGVRVVDDDKNRSTKVTTHRASGTSITSFSSITITSITTFTTTTTPASLRYLAKILLGLLATENNNNQYYNPMVHIVTVALIHAAAVVCLSLSAGTVNPVIVSVSVSVSGPPMDD